VGLFFLSIYLILTPIVFVTSIFLPGTFLSFTVRWSFVVALIPFCMQERNTLHVLRDILIYSSSVYSMFNLFIL